jgi:hypothetical protein
MELLKKYTGYGIFGMSIFFILFGRSFSGLTILNVRIGELIVGFLLLISGLIFFSSKRITSKISVPHKVIIVFKTLITAFVINFLIYGSSLSNLYVFRTSSYIWYISFLIFCVAIIDNEFITQKKLILNSLALIYLYILSTTYFPDFLRIFFINNSDKFDFAKGSDLLLSFVFVNYLNKKYSKNKRLAFFYFILISSIFLPLMLYMSKGAFIPAVIYILIELIYQKKLILNNKILTSLIIFTSVILFALSTFQVWGGFSFTRDSINTAIESEDNFSSAFQDAFIQQLEKSVENKGTIDAFFSFYTDENRIFSTDLQLNWRLQIWQDVYFDLAEQKKLFHGYGNDNIIPAMDFDIRSGMDKLNENVHNFLVNILARGGLIQVILFVTLFYLITKWIITTSNSLEILQYIIPIAMTSFFDASFESVRFPYIFYLGLAIIIFDNKEKFDINMKS